MIPTSLTSVTVEFAVGTDPTPALIKAGRGFLYDAKLSGTGNGSCASCHIDGEMDHLAWNLGDPTADMTSFVQDGQTFLFHPMKGPMTTQTLRGLQNLAPYHWRGDKPQFRCLQRRLPSPDGGNQISDSEHELPIPSSSIASYTCPTPTRTSIAVCPPPSTAETRPLA